MAHDDIARVRVGGMPVGIIGLKKALAEVAAEYEGRADSEVAAALLNRLCRKNFIPEKAREDYEKTFLREFKKFAGRSDEEPASEGLEIKVLGPGCAQCDRLEKELMDTMAETGIAGSLEHVRDLKEIGTYGVMGMPALLINGEVKCVGSVPPRSRLMQWLMEASKAKP